MRALSGRASVAGEERWRAGAQLGDERCAYAPRGGRRAGVRGAGGGKVCERRGSGREGVGESDDGEAQSVVGRHE